MYVTKEGCGCPIEAAPVIAQGGLSPLYVSEDIVPKLKSMPEMDVVMAFQIFAVTTEDGSRTDIFLPYLLFSAVLILEALEKQMKNLTDLV